MLEEYYILSEFETTPKAIATTPASATNSASTCTTYYIYKREDILKLGRNIAKQVARSWDIM